MTISEVAEQAGVSTATVSRVINSHGTVRPEAERKVREVIKQMGYQPRARRSGPKPQQSPRKDVKTLGVAVVGQTRGLLEHPFIARLFSGIAAAAGSQGIHSLVMDVPDMTTIPRAVAEEMVDAVIACGQSDDAALAAMFHPLPVVRAAGRLAESPIVDHVVPDNRLAGILAAEYLLSRGCQRPLYLDNRAEHETFSIRADAFSARLAREGIECMRQTSENPHADESGIWDSAWLRQELGALLDKIADVAMPDGIYVSTDQQAAVLYELMRARGIVPGQDVITISCNNDEPWLATMTPRPATIDLRAEEIGREAVACVMARAQRPGRDPVQTLIMPHLKLGDEPTQLSETQ